MVGIKINSCRCLGINLNMKECKRKLKHRSGLYCKSHIGQNIMCGEKLQVLPWEIQNKIIRYVDDRPRPKKG